MKGRGERRNGCRARAPFGGAAEGPEHRAWSFRPAARQSSRGCRCRSGDRIPHARRADDARRHLHPHQQQGRAGGHGRPGPALQARLPQQGNAGALRRLPHAHLGEHRVRRPHQCRSGPAWREPRSGAGHHPGGVRLRPARGLHRGGEGADAAHARHCAPVRRDRQLRRPPEHLRWDPLSANPAGHLRRGRDPLRRGLQRRRGSGGPLRWGPALPRDPELRSQGERPARRRRGRLGLRGPGAVHRAGRDGSQGRPCLPAGRPRSSSGPASTTGGKTPTGSSTWRRRLRPRASSRPSARRTRAQTRRQGPGQPRRDLRLAAVLPGVLERPCRVLHRAARPRLGAGLARFADS